MKTRMGTLLAATLLALGLTAGPAAAHILVVDPPGDADTTMVSGIGGGALPESAAGAGLIPGGPTGSYLQSPAHDGGLVTACERLRERGNGVVDLYGPTRPGGELTCRHGGQ